jgi:four helix bundle protein
MRRKLDRLGSNSGKGARRKGEAGKVISEAKKSPIKKHTDLEVYKKAFAAAMQIFELSKSFPMEERYSLTDQVRRSSRSVSANLAEAWRKRRYRAHWISKLSDCEAEAAETQTWVQFAFECKYLDRETGVQIYKEYDSILGMLVTMINRPQDWCIG